MAIREPGGDGQQGLAVGRGVAQLMNADVVADLFAELGDRVPEQPDQRVWPVHGLDEGKRHVPGIIGPPHVRQLVQHNRFRMVARVQVRE